MKKQIFAALTLVAAVAACEPAVRTIQPGRGPVSSAIAMSRDDKHLVIASEDHDQILVVDRSTREVVSKIDVDDGPTHVIIASNGKAVVSSRYGHSVQVVDVASGQVEKSIQVGVEPYGLVEVAPNQIAVALSGEQAVGLVDLVSGTVDKVQLNERDPRAVALLPDGDLYVSHMSTGKFSRVSPSDRAVRKTFSITTTNQFGPQTEPEHLRSLTVTDEGGVIAPTTQANTNTVRAPIDETGEGTRPGGSSCESSGYGGCPMDLPAVTPAVTVVDEDVVVTPQPDLEQNGGQGGVNAGMADCFDCGFESFGTFTPNPPSFLNPTEARFAGIPGGMHNPTAVALFDGGRGQMIVNMGTKNAVLLRRELKGTADDVIGFVNLGNGAQAVTVSIDGKNAYVWNQFDGTVSEIELPMVDGDNGSASRFVPDGEGNAVASQLKTVPEFAADTFEVIGDALPANVSLGRKLFHDATDSRIAQSHSVSCAGCHPDGRTDNRTWLFTFGPRNTPQLGGGILETAPFHWPGDVSDVPDLNRATVKAFMGGTGLDQDSFNTIAAFIDTIRAAPAPNALQAELTEIQARGKVVFESAEAGCMECHYGAHFTDNQSRNVGTRAEFQVGSDIDFFQTPVLHGLARSGPYLHDGSAKTLRDLVFGVVRSGKMGNNDQQLTNEQLEDLAAYLETL